MSLGTERTGRVETGYDDMFWFRVCPRRGLTSRVQLGQVVQCRRVVAGGLDQVAGEQRHGADVVLLWRMLLWRHTEL